MTKAVYDTETLTVHENQCHSAFGGSDEISYNSVAEVKVRTLSA